MKLILLGATALVLAMPAASAAQFDETGRPDALTSDAFADGSVLFELGDLIGDEEALRAGEVQLAARIIRRRAVVVGPRGRTFLYRGRPLGVIRRPAFIYPPGYVYRRWAVGALLPAALIATSFVFLEWQAAGLQPPPPGYVWVRHGPDVILVDERTRRVREVAYGAIEEE
jgi:Ni/Co efflux regulator RcnB